MTKPFLKWVGGKGRILDQLAPLVPEFEGTYHEPFLGGGAMFFNMPARSTVLSDANESLINCYKQVRDKPGRVINVLSHHAGKHNEAHYYRVRDLFNQGHFDEWAVGAAAAFIYLNKSGFNGLYRENKKGEFNVPWGKRKTFDANVKGIVAASISLKTAYIEASHYDNVILRVEAGDFVYFDPPYDETFTGYRAGGFGKADQLELSLAFAELVDRGCHVMLSNSDTPLIREIYKDWDIRPIQARRSVSRSVAGRGVVGEVVVTGGPK